MTRALSIFAALLLAGTFVSAQLATPDIAHESVPNEIVVGETCNWRAQKLLLEPTT